MEVWTEQFRLWLAGELLQPLDKLVRRAQKVPYTSRLTYTHLKVGRVQHFTYILSPDMAPDAVIPLILLIPALPMNVYIRLMMHFQPAMSHGVLGDKHIGNA